MSTGELKGERSIRKSANVAQQRTVAIYLVLGGLVFAGIAVGAALFTVGRGGAFAQRAALATVQRYIEYGREFDTLPAHRLYSNRALATTTENDVADIFAARRYFDGFEKVSLRSAQTQAVDGSSLALEAMSVEAIATYSTAPPAVVIATLEQADGTWRLRSIAFREIESTAP